MFPYEGHFGQDGIASLDKEHLKTISSGPFFILIYFGGQESANPSPESSLIRCTALVYRIPHLHFVQSHLHGIVYIIALQMSWSDSWLWAGMQDHWRNISPDYITHRAVPHHSEQGRTNRCWGVIKQAHQMKCFVMKLSYNNLIYNTIVVT